MVELARVEERRSSDDGTELDCQPSGRLDYLRWTYCKVC